MRDVTALARDPDELTALADALEWGTECRYELGKGEVQWLDWIGGRYCAADYIRDHTTTTGDGAAVFVFLPEELGQCLIDDGCDRLSCLADHAPLQRIGWICAGLV